MSDTYIEPNESNSQRQQCAQSTYNTLCQTLNDMKWQYQKDDQKRMVNTSAIGNDLEIPLRIVVSEERQLMYVKSALPVTAPEHLREMVGTALHIANFSMLNGCFEYDINDGMIVFKIIVPFGGCIISKDTCRYMIILTCQMVDKFNDKIVNLINGKISLAEFKEFAEK